MKIRLYANDLDNAEEKLSVLQQTTTLLDGSSQGDIQVQWGEIEISRGAYETIFEIIGELDLHSIAIGVASGVLANWLWNLITESKDVKVEITYLNVDVTNSVKIDFDSKEKLEEELTKILENKKIELENCDEKD